MIVRLITPADERTLRRLIMAYLRETYDAGGDFPPTLENAAAFARYAIEGAAEGDPCVGADHEGTLVGFCVARGLHFPGMQTRHKTVRSWGTYVRPEWRTKNTATTLFIVAGRLARLAGYTRFLGMTHGSDYEAHAIGIVNRIPGMQEVGKVMVMDLTRKGAQAVADDSTAPADEIG